MITKYIVFSAFRLSDGQIALAGRYSGRPLEIGQQMSTVANNRKLVLKVGTVGVVDPNLVEATKRLGVVVRLVAGVIPEEISMLEGQTFDVE